MDRPIKPKPPNGTQLPESKGIELREKQTLEEEINSYLAMYLDDCLSALKTLEEEEESGYFL